MAKKDSQYICNSCGAIASAWSGRCGVCGEWNTMERQVTTEAVLASKVGSRLTTESITTATATDATRITTNITEVDTVLGGGLVRGSVVLIAGQPGIGKSTLLMQITQQIAEQQPVLYVSAEESAHQVASREARLRGGKLSDDLKIATTSSSDDIAATILSGEYAVVVVDSVQLIAAAQVTSAPGSVSQITMSTQLLTLAAKQSNTTLIIVGHVTKEGSIAGPKVLEHVVDVVLQLEGDRYGGFKLLRAVKNRYGSTNEVGIFEMKEEGLMPVDNPSAALLSERQVSDGSVVLATLEGNRPVLVEVQALVNRTSYGYPKRAASGYDLNRLNLLVAMLEKRTKLNLGEHDIYINIVGGIKITEPAADLAIALAIGSAAKGLQLQQNLVVFGEVGLLGEVRHVPAVDKRLAEAKKLGFAGAIGPATKGLTAAQQKQLHVAKDVRSALNQYLQK